MSLNEIIVRRNPFKYPILHAQKLGYTCLPQPEFPLFISEGRSLPQQIIICPGYILILISLEGKKEEEGAGERSRGHIETGPGSKKK